MNNSYPPEGPVRVYFFERPDGSKIHVTTKQAWELYARPQQTGRGPQRFKYLGTSNGMKYYEATYKASEIAKEQGLDAGQKFLREAWEAELEIARQDTTPPPNLDTVDKYGQSADMRTL